MSWINNSPTDYLVVAGGCDANDLLDVKLVLNTLIKIGEVPSQNICLVIDFNSQFRSSYWGDDDSNKQKFWDYTMLLFVQHWTKQGVKVLVEDDATIERALAELRNKELVVIVGGHGSLEHGIAVRSGISPYVLVESIRKYKRIRNAVVLLSQCYSGHFNFVEAESRNRKDAAIVLMGGTNFVASYGVPKAFYIKVIQNERFKKLVTLFENDDSVYVNAASAINPFLLSFLEWFVFSFDLDGDGKSSLMDCYKYIAGRTEEIITSFRSKLVSDTIAEMLVKHKSEMTATELGEFFESQFNDAFSVMQTPWILNSRRAQTLTWKNWAEFT